MRCSCLLLTAIAVSSCTSKSSGKEKIPESAESQFKTDDARSESKQSKFSIDEDDARLARLSRANGLREYLRDNYPYALMSKDYLLLILATGDQYEVIKTQADDCKSGKEVERMLNAMVDGETVRKAFARHGFQTLHCSEWVHETNEESEVLYQVDLRGEIDPKRLSLESTRKSIAPLWQALWADAPEMSAFVPFSMKSGKDKTLIVESAACETHGVLDAITRLLDGQPGKVGFKRMACVTDGREIDSKAVPRFEER